MICVKLVLMRPHTESVLRLDIAPVHVSELQTEEAARNMNNWVDKHYPGFVVNGVMSEDEVKMLEETLK